MTSIRFGHPRQTTFELGTRPYLESLRLLSGENKEEIPLKSHRELAEIILTEKGHCKLLTQDKVIPVSEGSLILIGQGHPSRPEGTSVLQPPEHPYWQPSLPRLAARNICQEICPSDPYHRPRPASHLPAHAEYQAAASDARL